MKLLGFQTGGMVAYTGVKVPILQNKLRPTLVMPIDKTTSKKGKEYGGVQSSDLKYVNKGTSSFRNRANAKLDNIYSNLNNVDWISKHSTLDISTELAKAEKMYETYQSDGLKQDELKKAVETLKGDKKNDNPIFDEDGKILVRDKNGTLNFVPEAIAIDEKLNIINTNQLTESLENNVFGKDLEEQHKLIMYSLNRAKGIFSNEQADDELNQYIDKLGNTELIYNEGKGTVKLKLGDERGVFDNKNLKYLFSAIAPTRYDIGKEAGYYQGRINGNELKGLEYMDNIYGKLQPEVKQNYSYRVLKDLKEHPKKLLTASDYQQYITDDVDKNTAREYVDKVFEEGKLFAKDWNEIKNVLEFNNNSVVKEVVDETFENHKGLKAYWENYQNKNASGYNGSLDRNSDLYLKDNKIKRYKKELFVDDYLQKLTSKYYSSYKNGFNTKGNIGKKHYPSITNADMVQKTGELNPIEFNLYSLDPSHPTKNTEFNTYVGAVIPVGDLTKNTSLADTYGSDNKQDFNDNLFFSLGKSENGTAYSGDKYKKDDMLRFVPTDKYPNLAVEKYVKDRNGHYRLMTSKEMLPLLSLMSVYNQEKKVYINNLVEKSDFVDGYIPTKDLDRMRSYLSDYVDLGMGAKDTNFLVKEKNGKFKFKEGIKEDSSDKKFIAWLNEKNNGSEIIDYTKGGVYHYYDSVRDERYTTVELERAYGLMSNVAPPASFTKGFTPLVIKTMLNAEGKEKTVMAVSGYKVPTWEQWSSVLTKKVNDPNLMLSTFGLVTEKPVVLEAPTDEASKNRFHILYNQVMTLYNEIKEGKTGTESNTDILSKFDDDNKKGTIGKLLYEWYDDVDGEDGWFTSVEDAMSDFENFKTFAAPVLNIVTAFNEVNDGVANRVLKAVYKDKDITVQDLVELKEELKHSNVIHEATGSYLFSLK